MLKKKLTILILILVFLLALSFIALNFTSQDEDVKIGQIYYNLPKGYHIDGINEVGDITISNGYEKVYLTYYNNQNINKYINKYKQDKENKNETVIIENFTRNNTLIYKSTDIKSEVKHYWFIKDKKTYSIYIWEKNSDIENIFNDLFDSIH